MKNNWASIFTFPPIFMISAMVQNVLALYYPQFHRNGMKNDHISYGQVGSVGTYSMFHVTWTLLNSIGTNWERFQHMSCDYD